MADPEQRFYLRFHDRKYFGHSKYRPSEGWIDVLDHTVLWKYSGQRLRKDDPSVRGYFQIVAKDPITSALAQAAGGKQNLGDATLLCVQYSAHHRHGEQLYRFLMNNVLIGEYQPIDKQTIKFIIHCREPAFSSLMIPRTAILIGLLVPAVQK